MANAKVHPAGFTRRARQLAFVFAGLILLTTFGVRTGPVQGEQRKLLPGDLALVPDCGDCSVLLVSVDTLRADHLSAHGYARSTSPHIDALARQGLRFANAYSTAYVTAEAHMSMFTSLYPSVHGVQNVARNQRRAHRLPATIPTLAEHLRDQGLATAAFTSGGNIGAAYGFDRGMDSYQVHTSTVTGVERCLQFAAESTARGKRFFAFLHTYEAHDPYLPEPPYDRMFGGAYSGRIPATRKDLLQAEPNLEFARQRDAYWGRVDRASLPDRERLLALYDGEIRSVDEALGGLFRQIRELAPNTLIVLVSDHGEQFGEHGSFLHGALYDELLRVPLIVSHPHGGQARVETTPVSTLDLAPTLLEVLGAKPLPLAQGHSFAGGAPPRPIFAEKMGRGRAVIDQGKKLILEPGRTAELFDLRTDAGETTNLAHTAPLVRRELEGALTKFSGANARLRGRLSTGSSRGPIIDPVMAAQLEALGYTR